MFVRDSSRLFVLMYVRDLSTVIKPVLTLLTHMYICYGSLDCHEFMDHWIVMNLCEFVPRLFGGRGLCLSCLDPQTMSPVLFRTVMRRWLVPVPSQADNISDK